MDWLAGIDDIVFGGARRQDERTKEEHQAKMKQMASKLNIDEEKLTAFLKSQKVTNAFREAQTTALGKGRTIYGGRGYRGRGTATDPDLQDAIDIGKIQTARKKFEEIKPETAAAFDVAEKSVTDRGTRRRKEAKLGYSLDEEGIDPIDQAIRLGGGLAALPDKKEDVRGVFSGGVSPSETPDVGVSEDIKTRQSPRITFEEGMRPLGDYFQAGMEEENMTFEQLGITNTADQDTFQQLDKALPEMDLRGAYTLDPATFQMILKALRLGKAPNGKPFTIKDAIKVIMASQQ